MVPKTEMNPDTGVLKTCWFDIKMHYRFYRTMHKRINFITSTLLTCYHLINVDNVFLSNGVTV